jgi:hypothetical protein
MGRTATPFPRTQAAEEGEEREREKINKKENGAL